MTAAVVAACSGGAVLTAWALHLGASPLMLGTLWGLPYLAQVAQPVAAWLTTLAGAKRVAVWATTIGRQMLWGLALLPLSASMSARQRLLLACFGVFAVMGVVGNNAWTSWVAVLVPARVRGRYFGPRSARAMLVGTVASLAIGAYVDRASARGDAAHALVVTCAAGAAFGLLSTFLMLQQHSVPASAPLDRRALLAPLKDARARRVLTFQMAWSASTGIAASFYGAQALGALGLGVTGLAAYNTALALVRAAATPSWGQALDRAGLRPVLAACASLSACGSALWIWAAPGRLWLIGVDTIVSGVALSGMDLAVFMLPMAVEVGVAMPAFVAASSMIAGVTFGAASIAGGALAGALPAAAPSLTIRALFALSALGRAIAAGLAARIVGADRATAAPDGSPLG